MAFYAVETRCTDKFLRQANIPSVIALGEVEDRVAVMEEEIENLKKEVETLKKALRDRIARYEITQVKQGREIHSIVD